MQQIKLFCDVCGKECQSVEGASRFTGVISRLNVNLEKQSYQFVQDHCSACSEVVLNFISELKKDVEARRGDNGVKHDKQGGLKKK